MENRQYADRLEEIASLLQVTGSNPFRVRAFQRAARTISGLADDVDALLDAGTITETDGIGDSIAEDLRQIRETGSAPLLEELRASLPDGISRLFDVQGLGPKKVKKLYDELGIGSIAELEEAATSGQIAELSGFGKKTVEKLLREIERLKKSTGRTPFHRANIAAQSLVEELRKLDEVIEIEIAGSLRRGRETVGDLDIVVASDAPGPVMKAFVELSVVEEIIASGDTKSSVYLHDGVSADLRVVPPEVFGATLHHFTGSKDHNVMMRSRAQKMGLRISEWGVFRVDGDEEELIASKSESDVFEAVGLKWIPPELRQGNDELRATEDGSLPELISVESIRCDLHMHTTASDGKFSVAEMADAAASRGLEFIAITDHSAALTVANGLDAARLEEQAAEIDAYNTDGKIRVLKGLEADIMKDGSIDLGAHALESLDWVVGSVHQWMNMPAEEMTERLVNAVNTGLISAIGHPTGRLIGKRDPYPYDFDAVLDACAEMGVALEVNASPRRLDLNDRMLKRALERPEILFTINTDAHSTRALDQMKYGVMTAKRAWMPRDRVLNTLPLEKFLERARKPGRI